MQCDVHEPEIGTLPVNNGDRGKTVNLIGSIVIT